MTVFPAKFEFRLGVIRFQKREFGYPVRNDLDFAGRQVVNGTEEFVAFLGHDDGLRRNIDDPTYHVALDGRWFGEHRVKRGHNRHVEAR